MCEIGIVLLGGREVAAGKGRNYALTRACSAHCTAIGIGLMSNKLKVVYCSRRKIYTRKNRTHMALFQLTQRAEGVGDSE